MTEDPLVRLQRQKDISLEIAHLLRDREVDTEDGISIFVRLLVSSCVGSGVDNYGFICLISQMKYFFEEIKKEMDKEVEND